MDCKELFEELFEAMSDGKIDKCEWKFQSFLTDISQMVQNHGLISLSLIPCGGKRAINCLATMTSREVGA